MSRRMKPGGTWGARAGARLAATAAFASASGLAAACGTDPGEETARARGDHAFARGDFEEALAEYRLSLKQVGATTGDTVRAAHAYAGLGRVDDARSLYEAAVASDVSHAFQAVADFVAAARRADENGDSYAMASALEAAWSIGPGAMPADLALPLARHYTAVGESVRALPLYLMLLDAARDDPGLVLETARAHHEIGDCERALALFEEFVALERRRERETRWHVGSCAYRLAEEWTAEGRVEEALERLDLVLQAAEPRPLLPRAHYARARLLERLGRCAEALAAYGQVGRAGTGASAVLADSARSRVDEIRFGETAATEDGSC